VGLRWISALIGIMGPACAYRPSCSLGILRTGCLGPKSACAWRILGPSALGVESAWLLWGHRASSFASSAFEFGGLIVGVGFERRGCSVVLGAGAEQAHS
jgi:hypothetical protein